MDMYTTLLDICKVCNLGIYFLLDLEKQLLIVILKLKSFIKLTCTRGNIKFKSYLNHLSNIHGTCFCP